MQQRQAAAGEEALGRDMAKFAPSQRKNRRLTFVGRGQRTVTALSAQREPAPAMKHHTGNTQAGSWPEDPFRSQFDRGAGAYLTQICGVKVWQRQGQGREVVEQQDAAQAEPRLEIVARESPGSIGQPDHLTMDWCREGDSRCLQSRGANLAKVGLNRLHRPRKILHGKNAHQAGRASPVEQGKAGTSAADVGNQPRVWAHESSRWHRIVSCQVDRLRRYREWRERRARLMMIQRMGMLFWCSRHCRGEVQDQVPASRKGIKMRRIFAPNAAFIKDLATMKTFSLRATSSVLRQSSGARWFCQGGSSASLPRTSAAGIVPMNKADLISNLGQHVGADNVSATAEAMSSYLADWRGRYRGAASALCARQPRQRSRQSSRRRRRPAWRWSRRAATPAIAVRQRQVPRAVGGHQPVPPERVRAIDPANNTMTVEAGCVLQTLQDAAAEAHDCFRCRWLPREAVSRRQSVDQRRRRAGSALWQHA